MDSWEKAAMQQADRENQIAQEDLERMQKAAEEWKLKWPNHCKTCLGHGGFNYLQGHPYGLTTAYENMFDPCDALEPTVCHRCGEKGMSEDDDKPCPNCGWNYDDGCPGY